MDEGKQSKPGEDTSAENAARRDEATSGETLSDMKQDQTDSAAASSASGETSAGSDSESSAPAPDGMPDTERGGSGDGRDSGGPM